MALLFDFDRTRIVRHISNIYSEGELDLFSTCAEKAQVQFEGERQVKRRIKLYNLDTIISAGYRVKSQRGILFRKWANKVLKDYLIKGYAINDKKMAALNKTIEIQNKMLSLSLNIDEDSLANVINEYTKALDLLDDYDHQCVSKPVGRKTVYQLEYEECRKIIDSMKFGDTSSLFGAEKEEGKLNGILVAFFGSKEESPLFVLLLLNLVNVDKNKLLKIERNKYGLKINEKVINNKQIIKLFDCFAI